MLNRTNLGFKSTRYCAPVSMKRVSWGWTNSYKLSYVASFVVVSRNTSGIDCGCKGDSGRCDGGLRMKTPFEVTQWSPKVKKQFMVRDRLCLHSIFMKTTTVSIRRCEPVTHSNYHFLLTNFRSKCFLEVVYLLEWAEKCPQDALKARWVLEYSLVNWRPISSIISLTLNILRFHYV